MRRFAGIEAQLAWMLLFSGDKGLLKEPDVYDYSSVLEGMEAAELMELVAQAKRRLEEMGVSDTPIELFIDKDYHIRVNSNPGRDIPLRPLVRAVFILFLRHPEGILLKDRDRFCEELEDIYEVISPNTPPEDRRKRVLRLVNVQDNSFSEKLSVLNATLERTLPASQAGDIKVCGNNGHPRRIPLSPLLVHWEEG